MHGPLSTQEISAFREHGYLVLRDLISQDLQDALLRVVRQTFLAQITPRPMFSVLGPPPEPDEAFFGEWLQRVDELDHDITRLVYESCFATGAFQAIARHSGLSGAAAQLLACAPDALFLNSDRLRVDPPGPRPWRLGWHQETAYFRHPAEGVQFWGPLVWPSSAQNGSVELARGSHLEGHYAATNVEKRSVGAQQFLVPDEIVNRYERFVVEIDPGDVAIFSCYVMHRSSDPLLQQRVKYSFVGRFTNTADPRFSPYGPI